MTQEMIYKKYTRNKTKKIVDRLLEISNETELTPERLVEEAESPKSIFHDLFEWDNNKAGHLYRLVQARNIINTIKIVIEDKEIRAFENVYVSGEKNYKPIYDILDNQEYREQMINRALKEVEYWKEKYKIYKEFKPIFIDIEKVKKKLGKARRVA